MTDGGVSAATVRDWVVRAARAADEKQGNEILVLEVGVVSALTGWFVIVDGANERQVKTLVDAIEAGVAEDGGPRPLRVEGMDARQWVLVDYGDFVVHVFLTETRQYFELERLWSDVPRLDWAAVTSDTER
jgi:ribosome-associated protein